MYAGGDLEDHPNPDLKEAFDLSLELPADDADYLVGNPMLGPNQWPELDGMRQTVNRYYDATIAFGKKLLQGFALALGQPADVFDDKVQQAPSQLRLMHYPYDPAPSDQIGIGAHTDFEVFTLLRPTSPGLEVLNGAGEWVDVPPAARCVRGEHRRHDGDLVQRRLRRHHAPSPQGRRGALLVPALLQRRLRRARRAAARTRPRRRHRRSPRSRRASTSTHRPSASSATCSGA